MSDEYDPYGHLEQWDQRPNEPNGAYRKFAYYRDLGPTRSQKKVAEHFDVKLNTVYELSSNHKWMYRAAAYDREQERIDQEWIQDERRKAGTRHIRQAQSLQSKWIQRLQQLDPAELDVKDVIKYAEIATKLERQALGFDDLQVGVSGTITQTVESLSPEETRLRLEELRREMDNRLSEDNGTTGSDD